MDESNALIILAILEVVQKIASDISRIAGDNKYIDIFFATR